MAEERLCDLETPFCALISEFGLFNEYRVVDCRQKKAVGSPTIVESVVFWVIFDVFGQFGLLLWPGNHIMI